MALFLLQQLTAHILSFPSVPEKNKERGIKEMKILKQLLFAVAIMFCFSIAASAQKQDDKKPKKDPPVVVVKEKDPKKEDKPKKEKDDNVKKPPMEFYLSENRIEITSK